MGNSGVRKVPDRKKRPNDAVATMGKKDSTTLLQASLSKALNHGKTTGGAEGWKASKRELPRGDAGQQFMVPVDTSEKRRRRERMERFEGSSHSSQERSSGQRVDPLYKPLTSSRTTDRSLPSNHKKEASPSCGPLVGENSNLEKPYLRLTTFPRKEDVRPLKVLIKSLAHIKCRYLQTEDFDWANEQLKSVRQDMTVQRLRNRFVLDVYETHARILLEHGDLDEFNQCQTMIRSLTEGPRSCSEGEKAKDALGVHFGGDDDPSASTDDRASDAPLVQTSESQDEFRGYAILYALVRNTSMELKTELARAKSLGQNAKATTSCSCHAISVVQAVDDHDYRTFFRLYESAPHLSAYLMDFLVKRVRDCAIERILAAYRPNVTVEYFRECLRFQDLDETRRYLQQRRAVFVDEDGSTHGPAFWVDCKASSSTKNHRSRTS